MNSHQIYNQAIAIKQLPPEPVIPEVDVAFWRDWGKANPKFMALLSEQHKLTLQEAQDLAISGYPAERLRNLLVEAATIKSILNITEKGKYARGN